MRMQDIDRLILALDPNKIALGAVMEDIIENEIIPQIKKLVNSADDEADKSRLADLADELKKSTVGGAKKWNGVATKAINNLGYRDEHLEEQMAQDVALKFYSSQRVREFYKRWLENVEKGIARGKKEGTISGLIKLFSTVITLQTKEAYRKYMNTRFKGVPEKKRMEHEISLDYDTEEGRDVYESTPSRGQQGTPSLDDEFILDALRNLYKTFTRKWKPNDGRSIFFNLWMNNVAQGKPVERKILQDDFAEAYEKQTGESPKRDDNKWKSSFQNWQKEVRKEVSNFLKKKYDIGLEDKFVTDKIRKKMKKSSRNSMVGNVILRWMLASLKKF